MDKKVKIQLEESSSRDEDGQEGRKDLLEILPEEMWKEILNHVLDPTDLQSCVNTSMVWNRILQSKRQVYLFQDVFPLIDKFVEDSDVKNCREVCQGWKISVDKYMQHHPIHFTHQNMYNIGDGPSLGKMAIFIDITRLESFMQAMNGNKETNPFISRRVTFRNFIPRQMRAYWATVLKLLQAFGKEIWYCEIGVEGSPVRFYNNQLHQLLSLLPNLRVLTLKYWGRSKDKGRQQLREDLLPQLEHLSKLDLCHLPQQISVKALESYKQISSLKVISDQNYPSYDFNMQVPNLVDFSTNIKFYKFGPVSWPLRKLQVQIQEPPCDGLKQISALNGLGSTLNEATLLFLSTSLILANSSNGAEPHSELSSGNFHLQLPKLEKLNIFLCRKDITTLNFLQSLQSLKHLTVGIQYFVDVVPTEQVLFFGHLNRMYKSNIWNLLPNLISINIKTGYNGIQKYRYNRSNLPRFS